MSDSLSDTGVQLMRDAGLDVDVKTGLSEEELIAIIGGYDALIVRSATTVTAKLLAASDRLRIVGRAGVGVDNVDVEAASRKGVIVMNTPLGNITSAAEQAVTLLMAVARNVCAADAALKAGRWDKKKFHRRRIVQTRRWASSAWARSGRSWPAPDRACRCRSSPTTRSFRNAAPRN